MDAGDATLRQLSAMLESKRSRRQQQRALVMMSVPNPTNRMTESRSTPSYAEHSDRLEVLQRTHHSFVSDMEAAGKVNKVGRQESKNDIHCLPILPRRMRRALDLGSSTHDVSLEMKPSMHHFRDVYQLPLRPNRSGAAGHWVETIPRDGPQGYFTSSASYGVPFRPSVPGSVAMDLKTRTESELSHHGKAHAFGMPVDSRNPQETRRQETTASDDGEDTNNFRRDDWDGMYRRLMRYHQKHGHCRISHRDPTKYAKLGRWLYRQRRTLLNDDCRDCLRNERTRWERRSKLERLGVPFGGRHTVDARWKSRLLELQRFHNLHGHSCVLENHPKYRKLGLWLNLQRSIALSTTHPHRIQCRETLKMRKWELQGLGVRFDE